MAPGARPSRAHQSDNRCYTGFDNANPTTESLPALNYVPVPISLPMAEKWLAERWGGERWPRSSRRGGVSNGARSAPVPGCIDPTTDVTPVSITQIRHPNLYRSVAAKNGRARAPAKAPTQRGGSPRQAERSPACNRRLLRRGNTRWRAAGGEPPVRNNVT